MYSIYSFALFESDYSGMLTYDYSLFTEYSFQYDIEENYNYLFLKTSSENGIYEVDSEGNIVTEDISSSVNYKKVVLGCDLFGLYLKE